MISLIVCRLFRSPLSSTSSSRSLRPKPQLNPVDRSATSCPSTLTTHPHACAAPESARRKH